MNRFEHSHIDSAGIHTRQKDKAHLSKHMDENSQVLITIGGQQAKNGKWKGISYMKKNREGQILFVAHQSITTQDTKMSKLIAARQATQKAIQLGFRKIIMLVGDKEIELIWSNRDQPRWQFTPIRRPRMSQTTIWTLSSYQISTSNDPGTSESNGTHGIPVFCKCIPSYSLLIFVTQADLFFAKHQKIYLYILEYMKSKEADSLEKNKEMFVFTKENEA